MRDRASSTVHRESGSASEREGSDGRCLSSTFPNFRITIHIGRGLAHLPVFSKGVNTGIDSGHSGSDITHVCAHVFDSFVVYGVCGRE